MYIWRRLLYMRVRKKHDSGQRSYDVTIKFEPLFLVRRMMSWWQGKGQESNGIYINFFGVTTSAPTEQRRNQWYCSGMDVGVAAKGYDENIHNIIILVPNNTS